ncbi:MAG: hypothetical protein KGY74_08400 [Candidatus Cloacimonetes bacterium]|nr:hypothetical protein [Candidatus Cloacimonadota bacterium]
MGKLLLIIALSFILVAGVLLLTTGEHSKNLPETVSKDNARVMGKQLGNYALQYGIKQLIQGNTSFVDSTTGYIKNFAGMDVGKGRIDSIVYTSKNEAVGLDSYVTYNVSDSTYHHHSSALIEFTIDDSGLSNITTAIITGGTIELKAKAVIEGTVIEDSVFNFEETLGMTQQEIIDETKSRNSFIEYPSNNEPMPDSLTWMDDELKIQSYWEGAGILIVNGDLRCTAQIDFEGILIVFGSLDVGAHSEISGSVFVIDDTSAGAHATISFDADAIEDAFNSLPVSISYNIIEWNE